MTLTTTVPARRSLSRRVLRSPLVDLMLGPHGVDRYLELIRPSMTVCDARAEVVGVRRQTPRSVTLSLRCNAAWEGFRAGQFVRAGFEIGGVRHTRTYSPAGSQHASGRDGLELTVTAHPDGLVSNHLHESARPGSIVHLAAAQGEFVLPDPRPDRLVLISGGSGVTPVISMLRTLCDEGHAGEVVFLHYARSEADWLYERELRALTRRHRGLRVEYRATRGRRPAPHLERDSLAALIGEADDAYAAVCGPPALIDGARQAWAQLGGDGERMLAETFTPPGLTVSGSSAEGSLRFLRSERTATIGDGTLLEQAEAAGLSPAFGCRMGICHTCTCRKAAGAVRNLRTGEISVQEDEDIQLCVSVPAGDVTLEI